MNSVQVVPCVDSCVQLVLFNLKLRTALDIRRLFETNVLIAIYVIKDVRLKIII